MEKSIRVRILGRDYPLRVREGEEPLMREMASYVDAKMQAFKKAHPEQSDLVAAVMTSLALAEDVLTASEHEHALLRALDADLAALDHQLAQALPAEHS